MERIEGRPVRSSATILLWGWGPVAGAGGRRLQERNGRDRYGTQHRRRHAKPLVFFLSVLFPPPWPSMLYPQIPFLSSSHAIIPVHSWNSPHIFSWVFFADTLLSSWNVFPPFLFIKRLPSFQNCHKRWHLPSPFSQKCSLPAWNLLYAIFYGIFHFLVYPPEAVLLEGTGSPWLTFICTIIVQDLIPDLLNKWIMKDSHRDGLMNERVSDKQMDKL